MKWMEIIRVRTAEDRGRMAAELPGLTGDIARTPGLVDIDVYAHASAYFDFAIFLQWDTDRFQNRGSLPGLSLTQFLKRFGMVDHSVWTVIK